MRSFVLYLEETAEAEEVEVEGKKKKLSNEHAIDLFLPFVATLSIWFFGAAIKNERSILCVCVAAQSFSIEYFSS